MDLEQFIKEATKDVKDAKKTLSGAEDSEIKLIGIGVITTVEATIELAKALQTEFKKLSR